MKILIILSILCVSTSAMTLRQAFDRIFEELGPTLDILGLYWEYFTIHDRDSCLLVQQLINSWPPGFTRILNDPDYARLRNDLIAGGVEWDSFINSRFKPGYGYLPAFGPSSHPCPQNEHGGIAGLNEEIRYVMNYRAYPIYEAVTQVYSLSAEFRAIYDRTSANQVGFRNVRCSTEIRNVENIMRPGIQFDYFLELLEVVFGWNVVSC